MSDHHESLVDMRRAGVGQRPAGIRRSYGHPPSKLAVDQRPPLERRSVRRLDGYVRVSYVGRRPGLRFISREVQEEAIRAYVRARGGELARVHVDLNRSGRTLARPGLQQALERVASGETDGLVVMRLDRLARTVRGALEVIRLVEDAGAQLISIEDGFDSRSPLGRALMIVLLALAELQADRQATSSQEGKRRQVLRGVHPASHTPCGYLRSAGGQLEPDPERGPLIAEAFLLRAAGAGLAAISSFLCDAGLASSQGHADWAPLRLSKLFRNPVYLGHAFAGQTRNVRAHPPLVRPAIWLAAATATARPQHESTTVLCGFLRCSGCAHVLSHQFDTPRVQAKRVWFFRCPERYPAGCCPAPVRRLDESEATAAVARAVHRLLHAHDLSVGPLEGQLRAAEEQFLDAFGTPDEDEAAARVLSLWRQLEFAQLAERAMPAQRWQELPSDRRRSILRASIESIVIHPCPPSGRQRAILLPAGSRTDWHPTRYTSRAIEPFSPLLAQTWNGHRWQPRQHQVTIRTPATR